MYDYISLQANFDFSIFIDVDQLKNVFSDMEGCKIRSNASAIIQLGDYKIVLRGIKCDENGNYAYDNDSEFEKINLIEIDIPQGAESEFEDEIRKITVELSEKIGWSIDWRE